MSLPIDGSSISMIFRSFGCAITRPACDMQGPWHEALAPSVISATWLDEHTGTVHNKVISGFQALRQARAPLARLEPSTEGLLQTSGRTRKPLCHRDPQNTFAKDRGTRKTKKSTEISRKGKSHSKWQKECGSLGGSGNLDIQGEMSKQKSYLVCFDT
ncbi:hypothetical protein PoB_005704600 [Plakobranchus ocellatus]|uniref:Uncharacterized protein n=1 Tax=Plakobranchus ocellatus TaxID=259542 RepID=A0AAV4CGP0_9GAST|nr:hypothetical protein PoB_005704600 [Plakobranchus ocellatus]